MEKRKGTESVTGGPGTEQGDMWPFSTGDFPINSISLGPNS